MKHLRTLTLFILTAIVCSCARIGSPTGGSKDTIPPVMAIAKPMNKTTLFDEKKIVIYFDEFIKFKKLTEQLIISPPTEKKPIIKPEFGVSKKISIEFLDTLAKNTTYTINFGNSIVDNNEGNELGRFSYVFSTGKLLDSLSIAGKINNPYENKEVENIAILAYKNAHDTLVGNYLPNYVTNTLNSNLFSLENLSESQYKLIALEDKNNNYKYDKGYEKIAFLAQEINLKTALDSIDFTLFKESKSPKIFNPTQTRGNQIILGYQGPEKPEITLEGLSKDEYFISQEFNKDSLYVWFKDLPKDSIKLNIKVDTLFKDFTLLPRDLKRDTLLISNLTKTILHPTDSVKITYNIPITEINNDSILLFESDSISVPYKIKNYPRKQFLWIDFERKRERNYTLKINKTAFKDFLSNYNQKQSINFNTLNTEEYGEIVLNIDNKKQQALIIKLINTKTQYSYTQCTSKTKTLVFKFVEPNEYNIQIIKDTNKNSKYDTGNFELRQQPEEVINIKQNIKLRANSEIIENISID